MLPYYLGLGMLLNQHAFRPLINILMAEVWKTTIFNKELLEICNKNFNGDVPKIWFF